MSIEAAGLARGGRRDAVQDVQLVSRRRINRPWYISSRAYEAAGQPTHYRLATTLENCYRYGLLA